MNQHPFPTHEATHFQPILIERERTLRIAGNADEVFTLLEPDGRQLWHKAAQRHGSSQPLCQGINDTLTGIITFSHDSQHGQRWNVVAEHNRQARLLRSILFMPELELLVAETRCEAATPEETVVKINWRVAGLSPSGNEAVQQFFDSGGFERQYDAMADQLNDYLADMNN
jgi:hypothetical protein